MTEMDYLITLTYDKSFLSPSEKCIERLRLVTARKYGVTAPLAIFESDDRQSIIEFYRFFDDRPKAWELPVAVGEFLRETETYLSSRGAYGRFTISVECSTNGVCQEVGAA
jgi:hypothetical protein